MLYVRAFPVLARVLNKAGPASWPAKCHFGTIWVYRREHPGLAHNFKCAFLPVFQPNPPKLVPIPWEPPPAPPGPDTQKG